MSRVRLSAAAALLAGYAAVAAGSPRTPGRRERALFARINGGRQHGWLRVPQQWGTPWTLPAVAVLSAAGRRPRHALVAVGCLPVVKGLEVATKRLRPRPRPLYVQPTALRDDAPVEGGSMPSGHAALATCATVLMLPLLPRAWRLPACAVSAVSSWTRVHQGAHEPADALAGLLLGGGVGLAALEAVRPR